MTNRRSFLLGAAATSCLISAGCGWRLGRLQASSDSYIKDKLQIYTWSQYTSPKLLKAFTSKTDIQVLADVFDANEAMLAKLQAGGGSGYSLVYPSDYMVQKMVKKGLLAKIDHQRLNILDTLFTKFKNPTYDSNNSYSVPFSWGTTGFIYNSDKLQSSPDNWEYLWQNQEKLEKRITLLNDAREVMGGVLKMLGYSYNSQNEKEIKQAYEKLKILKSAIAAFDTDSWRNQILAGDLLIAMCYSSDAVKIIAENPQLKYITPKSGSSLWTDTIVILNSAPNIDGAYAWIDYILQPQISAKISQNLGIAISSEAGYKVLPKKVQNNPTLFPSEAILEKCERISPVGEMESVYERYWTELTSS
ncbi:MAG: spermidine/putrescine ABC transporter substrate-binding protein [Cyanobacteria bacterium P01_A01_bin.84]